MPVTLGTIGRFDSQGWSTLTPSNGTVTGLPGQGTGYTDDGSRLIYVSQSTGNDTTGTGTFAAPFQTLKKAVTAVRAAHPDWILCREGDTWTDEKSAGTQYWAGQHGMTGRLAGDGVTVEPAVFTSYSTTGVSLSTPRGTSRGARPVLRFYSIDSVNGDTVLFSGPQSYFVLRGIYAWAYKQDLTNPGEYDAASVKCSGFGVSAAEPYVLIEDCRFRACAVGVDDSSYSAGGTVNVRRCAIDNNITAIGLYLQHIANLSLVENHFHRNGWNANGTRFSTSHNVYGQVTNTASDAAAETWNYTSNLSTYGSHACLRLRQTGVLYANVVASGQNGFDYGGGSEPPGAVGGPRSITDNISLDCYGSGEGDFSLVAATSTYGTVTFRRNLAANHNADATSGIGNFSLPDNTGADFDSSNVAYNAGTFYPNTGAGNNITVVSPTSPSGGDLTRSLGRYAVEVMGLGSSADYTGAETLLLNAVLDNAEYNFDQRLHPNEIGNWIRAGFGMPLVDFGQLHHGGRGLGRF